MPSRSSLEQRETIRTLSLKGVKALEISDRVGLSIWTVRKWAQRLKKGAQLSAQWDALLNRRH